MCSEEGECEEDREGSAKKEHLTRIPEQETTPSIYHAIEQL